MHEMQIRFEAAVREMVTAANRLAQLGYVTSHGGNLSMRVAEGVVLITPTKVHKRDITAEDICFVDMQGQTLFAPDGRKPTSEVPFHLRVFQRRPDLRGVVHAHPPILTGFAIAGSDLLCKPILPEPVFEVGPMVRVPYACPGSQALADAFEGPLLRSNGFLMENHGALMTSDEGVLRAVDLMEMMEGAAQSILVAQSLGGVRLLTRDDIGELEKGMLARGLSMPGKPGENAALEDAFDA